ncbi:MAG TPA: lysophospholipid acyltransferase family protein [Candidatus Bipolaricaulota bacterium]
MRVPVLGSQLPRRGNRFSKALGRTMLRLFGWSIQGEAPDLPKFVAIAAPHTSNWDFYFGIAAVFAMGIRVSWLGKHTLFRPPFGPFFCWLGGIPADRAASHGLVEQTIHALNGHERMIVAMAPEGTRKRVETWRTGFYRIAQGARLPILLAYFDYAQRAVGLGPMFHPTGDLDADLQKILEFYSPIVGKRPK